MRGMIARPKPSTPMASRGDVAKNTIASNAMSFHDSQMGREPTWRA
ncbi:hypothetical protein J2S34_001887 [Nitrobacter winogradskyi]|uniref:Uncharacterized protein n=1 Tax=Nitrobacter winogradskyi TaxID=913 RepID=A0ACC6AI41_NITWI|nr:hypothetical protein [Nitrobacter winogradskyi]